MRIFTALLLPEGSISSICEWKRPLEKRYPSLKWVSEDLLHVTLRFFGDVDGARLERIRSLLGAWKPGSISFRITEVGTFGRKASPYVYWLGGTFPGSIGELARELGEIPDERGRKSTNDFHPHITVARRRRGPAPLLEPPEPISGVIGEVAVVNSRLTSEGPGYTYLDKFHLH